MFKPKMIKVEVDELEKSQMFLMQHLGEGTLGNTKFTAAFTLPTYALVVKVEDKRYLIASQTLIEAIVKLHERTRTTHV